MREHAGEGFDRVLAGLDKKLRELRARLHASDDIEAVEAVDAEELGRRMRALFIALARHGDHRTTVDAYLEAVHEIQPADSVDVEVEGSWGWWANRLMDGDPS